MRAAFDVAILGGGKAGVLLARQLRRHVPNASVVLFEKSRDRAFKVGESTVDICGKYLTKRLGLGSYLYEEHLPKNGIRFFFDREDRQGALEDLSEIGTSVQLPFPTFQIDRARFERDLLRMNAEQGVDVRVGVRVSSVELGTDASPHVLTLEEDGRPAGTVTARWIVDATGRSSLLARARGLRVESTLNHAAAWGRFRGVADIDEAGSDSFRARVEHLPRSLSTNHFCYPGYWIWFIPLGKGVTSIGVVLRKEDFRDELRTAPGLLAFLRTHRAVASLIEDVETLDTRSLGQLAYGASRFVDVRERWALVGEAAAFTDPLYSPGGDFIAVTNDWVTDLVHRDLSGESADSCARRAALYERAFALRVESTTLLYDGLYGALGSFELLASKWDFDTACYLNLWFEPYIMDRHLDLGALERESHARHAVLGVLQTFRHLFRDAERTLRDQGRFFEKNLGHLALNPTMRFLSRDFATPGSERRVLPRVRDAFQLVLDELRARLGQPPLAEPVPFSTFALGRPIS